MSVAEKLKEIIDSKGVTAYEVAKQAGVTQATLSRLISGETKKMSIETKEKLAKYFRVELDFFNDSFLGVSTVNEPTESYGSITKGVPFYDIDFTAGFAIVENNSQTTPDSYVQHPFFKGCDYVVRASGQSMAKIIAHGDAIGLVKLNNWKDFFPFGEIYAIVTIDGLRMVKIITKGETEDTYTLISKPTDSKKEEFPPQQIKKTSILQIFRVQASSHLF